MPQNTNYSLIIIGAGAAGLSAAMAAHKLGIDYVVLEASHRTGGRGLTEMLTRFDVSADSAAMPVDLGCHWMHCGSKNPLVEQADALGLRFKKSNPQYHSFTNGEWQQAQYNTDKSAHIEAAHQNARARFAAGQDVSLWDCMDQTSEHALWNSYWLSLMHSNDPDQVSIADYVKYDETDEDWPVNDGYGALIVAAGEQANVSLNSQVLSIEWGDSLIKVATSATTLTATKLLVTVSSGVLGSGDIVFSPALPVAKLDAIASLPMGNYNNLFFSINPLFFETMPQSIAYIRDNTAMSLHILPFDYPYLFANTAGRFAWWLEKQGQEAAREWLSNILVDIFGNAVRQHLGAFKASAWGFDPWIKGAYSSRLPGAGNQRAELAKPLQQKLYFAGEATSEIAFNTAHGAWITGKQAVNQMALAPV